MIPILIASASAALGLLFIAAAFAETEGRDTDDMAAYGGWLAAGST